MIAETSSAEQAGRKAAWISGIDHALISQFPRVRVLIWFDRLKAGIDWRINSSPSSLAAFQAMVSHSPFFR